MQRITKSLTTVILSGASVSPAIPVDAGVLAGFIMPAVWTTAGLTIEVSADGTNFYPLYDAYGSQSGYFSSPLVSTAYAVDVTSMLAWDYFRFRSGTSATPVTQGADRTITFCVKAVV